VKIFSSFDDFCDQGVTELAIAVVVVTLVIPKYTRNKSFGQIIGCGDIRLLQSAGS
jgi:hypothetical protein